MMFMNKESATALSLAIGGDTVRFDTPSDFEFALSGRIGVPAPRVAALIQLSDDMLLRDVEEVTQAEQQFEEALSRALENSIEIGPFLADVDPSTISEDHNWRSILTALNRTGTDYEDYKRSGLAKYLQFLNSRKIVARCIYDQRGRGGPDPQLHDGEFEKHKQTLSLDASAFLSSKTEGVEFRRVPKGETIEIKLLPQESLRIRLGIHLFSLVFDDELRLVDENGKDFALDIGMNTVGRDGANDVVVDEDFRTVSRQHLILQVEDRGLIRVTDISSLGTFMPAEHLGQTPA